VSAHFQQPVATTTQLSVLLCPIYLPNGVSSATRQTSLPLLEAQQSRFPPSPGDERENDFARVPSLGPSNGGDPLSRHRQGACCATKQASICHKDREGRNGANSSGTRRECVSRGCASCCWSHRLVSRYFIISCLGG